MYPIQLKLLFLNLVLICIVAVQCMPNQPDTQEPQDKSDEETTWITLKTENPDGAKAGDPNKPPKGQYTLKFVPLIRIIASFLPRLLSRFTSRIQGGRSLDGLDSQSIDHLRAAAVEKIFADQTCSTQHLGRWADPHNLRQFYECAVNMDSLPECDDVSPAVSRQIMQDFSVKHRSIRSINPSLSEQNKLIKSKPTSTPVVVYKVNPCVSLVLHVCNTELVYSSRLQDCIRAIPYIL